MEIRRRKIPTGTHWDCIESSGDEICFVCDKKFKRDQKKVVIGTHKFNGEKLHRHEYCAPGSSNWEKKFNGYIYNTIPKKAVEKPQAQIPVHVANKKPKEEEFVIRGRRV